MILKIVSKITFVTALMHSVACGAQPSDFKEALFSLKRASNSIPIEEDVHGFDSLYEEIKYRKEQYSNLFNFLKENNLSKKSLDFFKEQIDSFRELGGEGNNQKLFMCMAKSDYSTDRGLVFFLDTCFERILNSPHQMDEAVFKELYDQVVFIVRKSILSVNDYIFKFMHSRNPIHFGIREDGLKYLNLDGFEVDKGDVESQLYFAFLQKIGQKTRGIIKKNGGLKIHEESNIPPQTAIARENTITIQGMVDALLDNADALTNASIIYELNSIAFYLRLERSLLANCPFLSYDPNYYDVDKETSVSVERFILSKLYSAHAAKTLNKNQFSSKLLNKLLNATCKEDPFEHTRSFIEKIFFSSGQVPESVSVQDEIKVEAPQKKRKKKKQKKKKKKKNSNIAPKTDHPRNEKKNEGQEEDEEETKTSPKLSYKDALILEKEIDNIHIEEKKQNFIMPILDTSYQCQFSYGDFSYKRFIVKTNNLSYSVRGEPFSFDYPASWKKLEEKVGRSFKVQSTPNFAMYTLRFHYTHEGSEALHHFTISPKDVFVSGRRLFDKKFRRDNNLITAMDNFLSKEEKACCLEYAEKEKNCHEKAELLKQILSKKLSKTVVKTMWALNATHSESLILLAIAQNMPGYLMDTFSRAESNIKIQSMALFISSYRELCFRCRNLCQGFQWNLEELLKHSLAAIGSNNNKKITLSDDFSSLILGYGEITNSIKDRFPLKQEIETISLGSDLSKRKLGIVMRS